MRTAILFFILVSCMLSAEETDIPVTFVFLKDGVNIVATKFKELDGKYELTSKEGVVLSVNRSEVASIRNGMIKATVSTKKPAEKTQQQERADASKAYWLAKIEQEKQANATAAELKPFIDEKNLQIQEVAKAEKLVKELKAKRQKALDMQATLPAKINENRSRINFLRDSLDRVSGRRDEVETKKANIQSEIEGLIRASSECQQLLGYADNALPEIQEELKEANLVLSDARTHLDLADRALKEKQLELQAKTDNPFNAR